VCQPDYKNNEVVDILGFKHKAGRPRSEQSGGTDVKACFNYEQQPQIQNAKQMLRLQNLVRNNDRNNYNLTAPTNKHFVDNLKW